MIDTPPAAGNILSDAAIAVGQWLLIPTREDARSRAGVGTVLDRVIKVSESVGSAIRPVGVAMFGLDPRATKLNARAREELEAGLGGVFPVLDSTIRDAKKAQIDAKEVGVTASEYAELAETTEVMPWYEAAAKGLSRLTFAANADTLAGDYQRLAGEVATIIAEGRS
jgi:cellulose biosynthesis protein BcsQ